MNKALLVTLIVIIFMFVNINGFIIYQYLSANAETNNVGIGNQINTLQPVSVQPVYQENDVLVSSSKFSISFPGTPVKDTAIVNTGVGEIKSTFYLYDTLNMAFVMGYSDFPKALFELQSDKVLLEDSILTIFNKNNIETNKVLELFAHDNKTSKKKNVVLFLVKNAQIDDIPTINETDINDTKDDKVIEIKLEYKVGTYYDVDDNGIETTTGVVDITVESSRYSWEVDESNLCTRWETYSVENEESTVVCYGSSNCCSLVDLAPSRENWNEVFHTYYGLYGATLNNIISSQIIYADYNLSGDVPYSEIVYSEFDNLTTQFYTGLISFDKVCIDTCDLINLNQTIYTLIIEINDTTLNLEDIDYIIEKEVEINIPPTLINNISDIRIIKNQRYVIDLNDYFYDVDGDILSYDYLEVENISVSIEGSIATIIPEEGFLGIKFMFFEADDSLIMTASNIFKIEIVSVQTIAGETFEVRNVQDDKLAVFDGFGNLNIKGNLTQKINLVADDDDFIVKNSLDEINMVITNPQGNVIIKNNLNENQFILNPTINSFVIDHKINGIVAYLNNTGGLFLRGELRENVLFG